VTNALDRIAAERRLPAAVVNPTTEALARLGEWVNAATQTHSLVAQLINGSFVPDSYKPRIMDNDDEKTRAQKTEVAFANATAAVLLGLGIGVDPLTALQQIIIIKGRPGMYAKFKVALLLAHGYDIWDKELTDESVTVCGVRPGDDKIREVTITMADAKRAGWTSNDAYAKTPKDMLWARAAGRLCDRIGGNVLLGIPTAEDNADADPLHVEAQVGRVTADVILAGAEPKTNRRRPRNATTETPPDPPAVEEQPPAVDNPVEGPGPSPATGPHMGDPAPPPAPGGAPTQAAMRRMFALLKETGHTDKDEALQFIRDTIGRSVISRAELTAGEVAAVIDALDPDDVRDDDQQDGGER
jgi:hypothetical protein